MTTADNQYATLLAELVYAFGADAFDWHDGGFTKGRPVYLERCRVHILYDFAVAAHHGTRDALLRAGLIEAVPVTAQRNLAYPVGAYFTATCGKFRLTAQGMEAAADLNRFQQEALPVAIAYREWYKKSNYR
jgi:hypothetical protein